MTHSVLSQEVTRNSYTLNVVDKKEIHVDNSVKTDQRTSITQK